jgi:hypothetical protein
MRCGSGRRTANPQRRPIQPLARMPCSPRSGIPVNPIWRGRSGAELSCTAQPRWPQASLRSQCRCFCSPSLRREQRDPRLRRNRPSRRREPRERRVRRRRPRLLKRRRLRPLRRGKPSLRGLRRPLRPSRPLGRGNRRRASRLGQQQHPHNRQLRLLRRELRCRQPRRKTSFSRPRLPSLRGRPLR